ncbi:uncharacterized protein [Haliotis asinina]|uniref:uncharacterized protein n=1 Tax=Haliotis asinina TaxID=109174 RepID=UPI003531CDB7
MRGNFRTILASEMRAAFTFAVCILVVIAELGYSFVFKPPCEIQRNTCYAASQCPTGTRFLVSLCFDNKICCVRVQGCSPDSCINGTCTQNTCSCHAGFSGANCDVDACAGNGLCQNGGVCQRSDTEPKYSCVCAPGYHGLNCDVDACMGNGPCLNGGTCNRQPDAPYYTCSCPLGFTGANCDIIDVVPPCGMAVASRIVGASPDEASQNPWLVKVVHAAGFVLCSGVIIDREWIVVDAFCVALCDGRCNVVMGDYEGATVEAGEQVRSLTNYSIHPNANFNDLTSFGVVTSSDPDFGLAYNVAVARLSAPITFSNRINRVCPPSDLYNVFRSPRTCVIAGYGKQNTEENVHLSTTSIRQVADAVVIDDSLCTMLRGKTVQPPATHCAFLTTTGSGLCVGDNGGAVVCQDPTLGFWTIEGITSYLPDGSNGACSGQVNVFTYLNEVWGWIQGVIAAAA